MPARGWPLMELTALWLIGRLAVAGALGLGPVAVMVVGTADCRRRLGFAMVVMPIMLIGGWIIPSFTRNRLVKQSPEPGLLPVPFGRFDAVSLDGVLLALTVWMIWPMSLPTGVLLVALGLSALADVPPATGFHLLGIGGFGGMTVAVMMRASLGHTGRALEAGAALTLAFACVALAAVVRVAVPGLAGLWIAATLWTAGFGLFVWHFAPVLTLPNPARRQPNGR